MFYLMRFIGNISPAVATEPVLPLLMHLERVEDEEEEDSHDQGDDEDQDEAKTKTKRNVSIDNYIAWGILQVHKKNNFLPFTLSSISYLIFIPSNTE